MNLFQLTICCLWLSLSTLTAQVNSNNWSSDVSMLGYSGNIIIPSAYLGADKTLNVGYSHLPMEAAFQEYSGIHQKDARLLFLNMSFLPFMEVTFGLNKPLDFEDDDIGLGDRTIIARFQLMKERKYLPAILVGFHDTFTRSSFTNTNYIVLSKQIKLHKEWTISTHLGYGKKFKEAKDHYLLGAFAGANIKWKFLGALIEYDADRINVGFQGNLKNKAFFKVALLDNKYLSASASIRFLLGKKS